VPRSAGSRSGIGESGQTGKIASADTTAIRGLIDSGPLAHVTTLNTDGSPQVSVVWVGLDGNEFVTAHMGEWQEVKNLRKDPRVARSTLSVDSRRDHESK
jgi:predicted pyridoxine 5'-phosphate oxidase superfamily flavin-nucleotide-binding protein